MKAIKLINESFNRLRESIDNSKDCLNSDDLFLRGYDDLDEAYVDPQTIPDSEILRGLQKKIGGKKLSSKNITPEEQEVLDKYGLDAWGYKGDTKMVTPGSNNILGTDWSLRRSKAFEKGLVNLADRASKMDDRQKRTSGISTAYVPGVYNPSFKERNDAYVNDLLSKNYSQMKSYLSRKKDAQQDLDSGIQDYYDSRIKDATNNYEKSIAGIDRDIDYYNDNLSKANSVIQNLLDKKRAKLKKKIGECLRRIDEAKMSPEDAEDTALLKSIFNKLDKRSNARLTPEEQDVLDKYGLFKEYGTIYKSGHNPLRNYDTRSTWDYRNDRRIHRDNSKINLADRARKLGTRSGNYVYSDLDSERSYINDMISADTDTMKKALNSRRLANINLKRQDIKKADAQSKLANSIDQALSYKKNRISSAKNNISKAQAGIDSLLNRNKNESLNENYEEKSIIRTNLDSVVGANKAEEIFDSILGQISDGMWENSPGQDKYWRFATTVGPNLEIDRGSIHDYSGRYIESGFGDKSDEEVLKFFGNRLKTICQEFLHDNNMNPYRNWNEDNEEICDYIDRHEGNDVTVGDCYKAFRFLTGRG